MIINSMLLFLIRRCSGVSAFTKRNILVAVHVLQSETINIKMNDDIVKLTNHLVFRKRMRQFMELVEKDTLQ